MQWKINLTRWFVYKWRKPNGKNPIGWVLGHHSRNSTIITTTVTSKGIPVPYTNLQLNPYPNIQLDLFCSDNFSFWCTTPSTWLTNTRIPVHDFNHQLEKVVGYKVLWFIPTMKIKKILGHKTLRCTYTATSSQEWWTRAKFYLWLQIAWTNFA